MALIDHSKFVGEINVPGTGSPEVRERLVFFIAKYEEKLLRALLGHTLYEAFIAAIATQAPDQKWIDLRDGKTFNDLNGINRRFAGLPGTVANYTYYWWQRDKASITTVVGEAEANTDGAERESPAIKMTRAWNEMVEENRNLFYFLDANAATYPEWDRLNLLNRHIELLTPINSFNI